MPSNYDDVIRKNREYLTQAQISALAAAAKEYNIQNAGQRAGALASAREQYDTGYRGLQNMGLAGNISGADTSGEVPRLRAEIAAPFDSFNRRLNDVENKRLNALGGHLAQQTQAARAAEAVARAQAQAAQAKAQADAAAAAARGARGQYDIDRSQTALIGERGEKSMPSKKAIDTYRQSGKALEDLKAIEATRTAVANAQKAQQDGMLRTQQIKERAAVMAAASVLGVQTVGTDNMALVRSVNNAQASGAKRTEQLKGYADTATANRYDATGLGRLDQGEQERTAAGAKEAYERVSAQARAGKATAEQVNTARQAFLNAQKSADETPKAFDIDHEAARKEAAAEKAKLDGMKRTAQLGGSIQSAEYQAAQRKAEEAESAYNLVSAKARAGKATANDVEMARNNYRKAQKDLSNLPKTSIEEQQARYETAKLKAEDPGLYSAYVIKNTPGQDPQALERANQIIVDRTLDMYGIRKPEWSDSDYKGNVQKYRAVKQMVAQADQVESGGGITDGIAARLKEKYGFKSIDEAREYVRTFGEERDKRSEYNYYAPAFEAAVKNEGLQPSKPVNNQEWDYTYRAVNNLPDFDFDTDRPTKTGQQMALVDVEYMTQQQRDAYNALYETQGIDAANAYAEAITPIVNIQRAAEDKRYYSELAKDHPVAADIMSVGMNLIGNVPAMASKLVTGVQNAVSGADVPKFIDINSNVNRISTGASTIRGARTELVGSGYYRDNATNWLHDHGLLTDNMKQGLDEFNDKAWVNNTLSFLYQSGMSMADSAAAMAIASMTGPWATDILFFSSAGNEAYNDARQRGATQEEALSYCILSGCNEALFEHVSVETFMENFVNSTPALAKNWLAGIASQSFTEASEEVCTEIANIYADMIALGDKSDWVKAQKQGPEAFSAMMNDKLKGIGMAGLGGLISGLGFGVFGGGMNAVRKSKYGSTIKSDGRADQYMQQARLLGGEDLTYAADSYAKKQSNNNAAELGIKLEERIKELSETKPGAAAKSMDVPAALTVVLEGSRMSAETGTAVLTALGAETVESMGYNATSGEALANSYNERIDADGITSRSDALAQAADKINNSLQQLRGTGAMGALRRDVTSAGFQRAGAVAEEYAQRRGEQTYTAARNAAATSVWANPTQGLAVTQADGTRITPMPGNMTAVERAEQERTNFQTRSTATKGRVTYAVAGMEARQGLSNEQTYSEIQNGLTKEARKKAQVYEKLADALGVNMVIHDVMTGTNGFIDEKGSMHVVLSGKQSVLRVAAHELTHWMKEHNDTGYASMREHLVKDVGQERFDRMLKQKAREYGIDMSTEKGRTVADDEVCAELCERMLADTDALERFAEKDTESAKTLKDRLLKILNAIKRALKDIGNRDFGSSWSDLVHEQETIESWISNLQTAIENADQRASTNEGVIGKVAGSTSSDLNETISDIKEANTVEEMDDAIAEHSVDVIAYDMAGYMDDLKNAKVMSASELKELMRTMNAAIVKVKAHRAILDFGAELNTEEEILAAKESRAYFPYKQNADPHYKLALDFSTLCRKRTLLQTIQERLQAKMGRATTQEETVAIRLELQKLQRQGYHVEVACALCYVEAARLKSPKVINAFLNNTANEMRNYFAKKNPASKQIIEGMQQQWKVEHGLEPTATKQDMKAAGVSVDAYNNYSRDLREQFEGSANEEAIVARAVDLAKNHREVFLSAAELTKLKKTDPDIFNAFTDKVRSATRSKAQETDTFYSRGDIDMVTEAILKYANAESGFRHQSWSDFVPTHLLDTMAAVIEMSTRKAKMHAYTKVPAMVRLLGKTGMALNMSLIPSGNTGIDANGNLVFDSVEGMPWETMMELRDMFPETAGNIAIGINDGQIQKMLASKDIDYVIPYHASGMNKNMRGYLDIRAWSEYTSSQNEKTNHRGTKGKAPELAEWFDEKAAANATDGEAFMREASEKYLQLCYERNLIPKFSQYLTNNGDGSYSLKEGYENYWKMLTDRKMVNQVTGKVIIQQAVKPTFDQATVLGILEDRLHDPAIQDADEAADIVTEKFSDWQANRNNASAEAIQEAKNIRDRTAAITAQKTAEAGGVRNSLDTDYLRLAEKYKSGTATEADTEQLQQEVDQAAQTAGYTIKAWHGSRAIFTEFSSEKRGANTGTKASEQWFFAGDFDTANSYYPAGVMRELMKQYPAMYSQKDIDSMERRGVAGKLYPLYLKMENPLIVDVAGYDYASHKQSKDAMMEYVEQANREGRDGIILLNARDNNLNPSAENSTVYMFRSSSQAKLADPVTYDNKGNIIPLSERFNQSSNDIRYDLDTDTIREAFTVIDTAGMDDALKALTGVKHVGTWALKDISRFLDATAGKDKDLRNTLSAIFEKPHSDATGRYARGVERMQQRVLDIGARAGVVDEKGRHFDAKKSAAIQNIGEGFSNTYTDLKLKVKDADHVTVRAYEQGTEKLVVSERDYTLKELRQAYGTNAADYVWGRVFDETQKAQETGKQAGWVDESVNTRPYTIEDLQAAFPNDWQQLKQAADEFRDMYDEYIRDQNNMLRTIYPYTNEYESVEKIEKAINKKQERLAQHKAAVEQQLQNLQKSLDSKEQEIAGKKRTDTKAYRNLTEQANRISDQIAAVKAEIAEYEANVKEELAVMNAAKAEAQNAVTKDDSLQRMHRLQYRSDYFHHFQEMASGIQNLRAIFTNNTDQDISPKIVGRSENTKAKTKWAGYYQQRMGGDYTADALNGMLRYGQLAEYKLAFDPLTAYLRDVNKQIRDINDDTNRDGLIRYIDQWADAIAGKSHKLDRMISDAGMAPRKAMQILNWINSRVIQNTLLYNMRSSLIQISNITNAKGIVTNNLDWMNGLRCWAAAAKGNDAMASIMAQSNFLASRYMDNLQLTESAVKKAKNFGGWLLGALDEVSAKATWWAAYTQYQRNPNAKVIKNAYRTYDNAIDYADDVTRRTHAGRGVGELAPAMTSRVISFVAPFQVEVNNTFELFKDNVKRGNYLGLLSTGLSVFLFNTVFEAIVGSSPLQFDFIRAVLDIVLGFVNDDPKEDDDDYGILQAWQRLSGEAFGSLPYAGQIASIIGEDVAKKIFGEDNDATRYGNTQIGISAVMNAGKGLYDIGKNLAEGKNVRQINWIADLDDLVNLTLPMGGKQLTRSIQGLYTVAQGYAGSNDKEGNEKVQFVTDQDVGHYIHAGLFGKWALTEASEYFGEKRLLPQLFGKYEGPKSSLGKPVDAQEYKAALEAGITGKEYFTLKSDLSEYSSDPEARAEMMEQSFTPEQKAKLDFLLITNHGSKTKVEDGVLYTKDDNGDWNKSIKAEDGILYSYDKKNDEWVVKTDYTSATMFELSAMGAKMYTATRGLMADGMNADAAMSAARAYESTKGTPDVIKGVDDRTVAFRNMLFESTAYTSKQKEQIDLAYIGNKYAADYTDKDLFELSQGTRSRYEKGVEAKKLGMPVGEYVKIMEKKDELTEKNKKLKEEGKPTVYINGAIREEILNSGMTLEQKQKMDDLLINDKVDPDYSTQAWFDVSMLGKSQYETAQLGAKVGLKPETYMAAYNKYKEIQAKDSDGKYVNTKAEARKLMKEYLDGLTISAPVYDYIWYNVFKQKKK